VGEEARRELRHEVAAGLVAHERLEHDGVGAPVGVQQEVGAVLVRDGEVRGARVLGDAVRDAPADGLHLGRRGRVLREDGEHEAESLEREAVGAGLAHERPRRGRVGVAE
jgi:hypothetical protein